MPQGRNGACYRCKYGWVGIGVILIGRRERGERKDNREENEEIMVTYIMAPVVMADYERI